MQSIKRLCIFGGTHGNELSGVYMVKKFRENAEVFTRPSFETKACITNPRAVEINRRYVDTDLNRAFSPENFVAKITKDTAYEVQRAQEIKAIMSEGGEIGKCDVLLDLHNTTANTKLCLIFSGQDPITTQMLYYVSTKLPDGMCYCMRVPNSLKVYSSRSLAPCGVTIEVGPQPQGVIRADIFNLQEAAIKHCLDFVENFNNGAAFSEVSSQVYEAVKRVNFPRDHQGNISAMIHENLQDNDWSPLASNDPVFQYVDGRVLYLRDVVDVAQYDGETLYPMFINEAAYYEKDVAFCLTKKVNMKIPELQKQ